MPPPAVLAQYIASSARRTKKELLQLAVRRAELDVCGLQLGVGVFGPPSIPPCVQPDGIRQRAGRVSRGKPFSTNAKALSKRLTKSADGSSRAGSMAAINAPMKAPMATRT
jgi:hypothetical protein